MERDIQESIEAVKEYEQLKKDGHQFTLDEIYDWTAHQRIIDGE
ncbi:hypothetical protein ACIOG3_03815 [Yersinia rochesterensis]|nr:hypothetical protein [Yersinia rochesterensis]AIN18937.1 hypothetical protein DJ57_2586 [Yersinia rochesterensis]